MQVCLVAFQMSFIQKSLGEVNMQIGWGPGRAFIAESLAGGVYRNESSQSRHPPACPINDDISMPEERPSTGIGTCKDDRYLLAQPEEYSLGLS